MPIEKAFDPTVSRINTSEPKDSQVPDDIDISDDYQPSAAASDLFVDTLDDLNDTRMPPPLAGETTPSTPMFADVSEKSAEMMENVRAKLSTADTRVRAFVERRPIVALCGAAAAGFFIGRIVSRI
jgi:hypothetical protein